jgi:hypothetical protein
MIHTLCCENWTKFERELGKNRFLTLVTETEIKMNRNKKSFDGYEHVADLYVEPA